MKMNAMNVYQSRRPPCLALFAMIVTLLVILSVKYDTALVPILKYKTPDTASLEPYILTSDDILRIKTGKMNMNILNTDQSVLAAYIQRQIIGPSEQPLNLTQWNVIDFSQADQSAFVDYLFGRRQGKGFFVEVGAFDGETFSNTLFLERERNWTGLLIEANPYVYMELLHKHRKAYSINACLSPSNKPEIMEFKSVGLYGGIADSMDKFHEMGIGTMMNITTVSMIQCFPLHSILQAMGQHHVSYLSLDVEGPEIEILYTIPWDKLKIDVLSVEYKVWDGTGTSVEASIQKLERIRECMNTTGLYKEIGILPIRGDANVAIGGLEKFGLDVVFQRNDFVV